MDERILKWLYDIKIAIGEIDGYFPEQEKDFLKYRQNLMLKRAVEKFGNYRRSDEPDKLLIFMVYT